MSGRILTITSGKGGVGKSTVTGNLAVALAQRNQRVTCLDLDIGLRNLDLILGLENRVVYDVMDVIEGRVRWQQSLVRHKQADNLFLLPAAQWREKDALTDVQITRLCHDMIPEFDFLLLDCPAGIEEGFRNAIAPADEIIIVATPEVSSIRDAGRVIDLSSETQKLKQKLILNRVRPAMVTRGDMLSVSDCVELLGIELLGIIFEDPAVIANTNLGIPVATARNAKAGIAFDKISRRLLGENVPLDLSEPSSWQSKLSAIFGR